MHDLAPKPLLERLMDCSNQWTQATGRSLGALASVVVNHGSFFNRLSAPDASTTTATLERFARFLGDAANWPDGAVPDDVRAFVHVTGVSTETEGTSTGQINGLSGVREPGPAIVRPLRQAQGERDLGSAA